ncbi:hypothetical protein PPYR_05938 [Photinus pyralis]|uniref:Aminopeptidase n=4 Tax=Photinus pyralis TaxID=7054 RepID=A0A5N4ASK0_PHOPY|nr:aminopeptidase N-like [Photinus pyralis]XP_031338676.1 aminopeptidase N-like [Photinus pyralis]KAB0800198.1 hypothetical protein PPYR_05938 [Photinus pyralis]
MGRNSSAFNNQRSEFISESDQDHDSKSGGCFVSTKKAVVLAVLAILCLGAVGATIYFYGHKIDKQSQNENNTNDLEALLNDTLNNQTFEDFRLPLDIFPLHYRLRIHPLLDESSSDNFTFTGEVTILMHCSESTKAIILHADQLNILQDQVEVSTTKDVSEEFFPEIVNLTRDEDDIVDSQSQSYSTDDPPSESLNKDSAFLIYHQPEVIYLDLEKIEEITNMSRYIIHLKDKLQAGENYTVNLQFSGTVSNNLLGLYRTKYLSPDGATRWILNTHFQPIFARMVFPCFDEPSFKASFEISVARKTNMSSLSNMPLKESEEMPNQSGWVWDHFDTSPPMSPHLVAFTIFDFGYVKVNASELGTVLKIWAPNHLLAEANYAADISPNILSYLQTYFGVKFPLPKLDMVAVPELYQTAMENWGLIRFRDDALLLHPSTISWDTKNHIFRTMINKFAKQWIGNLVTMNWWSEIWLSEGFSAYLEDVVQNAIDPTLKDLDIYSLKIAQTSLDSDKLKSVQSLQIPIKEPTQIEQLFDDVAYNKGSCLLRMLNWTITEEEFKKGIKNYLTKWKYKCSTIEDFWNSFTNVDKFLPNGVSLKEFMDSWITQDGYPVLTVRRDYEHGSASITQRGFINSHSADHYLWYIPLTYLKEAEHTPLKTTWMINQRLITISNFTNPGSKQWSIFNVEGTGLYRVNYDDTNWNLLKHQLMKDASKISSTDRGQLLNDAFELANFNLLNYSSAFEITKYMKHREHNYIPWNALFNSLKQLNYIIRTTQYRGIFENYIINLITPTYIRLGNVAKVNESLSDKLLRTFILSKLCTCNYEPCLEWSRMKYKEWMDSKNPDVNIPIAYDFRKIASCTAIKMGGRKEWFFLWRRTLYPSRSTANLKIFYSSLGCTREPWLINNYLENAINGTIPLQYSIDVWKSLTNNPVALNFGFAFLRSNWERINKNYQHIFINLNIIFEEFLSKLSTNIDLEDLTNFYKDNEKTLTSVSSLMLDIVEKIKSRVSWKNTNLDVVIKWIEENSDQNHKSSKDL